MSAKVGSRYVAEREVHFFSLSRGGHVYVFMAGSQYASLARVISAARRWRKDAELPFDGEDECAIGVSVAEALCRVNDARAEPAGVGWLGRISQWLSRWFW